MTYYRTVHMFGRQFTQFIIIKLILLTIYRQNSHYFIYLRSSVHIRFCMLELELKENSYQTDILSNDVSYHQTASCNPTSKKLESCNHCCVLGLLMYFESNHNLFPSILYQGSYDNKHKTCIFTMQIFKVQIFLAYQQ